MTREMERADLKCVRKVKKKKELMKRYDMSYFLNNRFSAFVMRFDGILIIVAILVVTDVAILRLILASKFYFIFIVARASIYYSLRLGITDPFSKKKCPEITDSFQFSIQLSSFPIQYNTK
jgi:hypothetical protein